MNKKEILTALKKARGECVNTVDNSTIDDIDKIINAIESDKNNSSSLNKMDWIKVVVKVLTILRLVAGISDGGE